MARSRKRFHQDRVAMRIADRYGLTYEYKLARRHHLSPIEALQDWDMLGDHALDLWSLATEGTQELNEFYE